MARPENSDSRKQVRLNLILRTTRQVRAYNQPGAETRLDKILPANSLINVMPDYQGCQQLRVYGRSGPLPVQTFLRNPGYTPDEHLYIPADAVTYATDGQAWCQQNCNW